MPAAGRAGGPPDRCQRRPHENGVSPSLAAEFPGRAPSGTHADVIRTLRYGTRAVEGEKTRILQGALDAVRPGNFAAAFDLDGTLLSNKPRQARIVRDFGSERDAPALARCGPEMIVSWDLHDTMRLCGLSQD